MVILKAYRRVQRPLERTGYAYSSGGSAHLCHSQIYRDLDEGKIKDLRVPVVGGELRGVKGVFENHPHFEVDWEVPVDARDRFASILARLAKETRTECYGLESGVKSDLWFARSFNTGERDLSYEVHFDQAYGLLRVRLPKSVLTVASGSVVNGFVYGRKPKEQRERLFDEVIVPLERDVRAHGFATLVTRFDEKCMTTLCFEPRRVSVEDIEKFVRRFMEEDVEVNYNFKKTENTKTSSWNLCVQPVAVVNASFFGGDSSIFGGDSSSYCNYLTKMGMFVPADAQASYLESYGTAFGGLVDAGFDLAGRAWKEMGRRARDLAYRGSVRKWSEARKVEKTERERNIERWLKTYAPRANKEFGEGCIIIVDPACELEAAKGKPPEVKVAAESRG